MIYKEQWDKEYDSHLLGMFRKGCVGLGKRGEPSLSWVVYESEKTIAVKGKSTRSFDT